MAMTMGVTMLRKKLMSSSTLLVVFIVVSLLVLSLVTIFSNSDETFNTSSCISAEENHVTETRPKGGKEESVVAKLHEKGYNKRTMRTMAEIQRKRKEHLAKMCSALNLSNSPRGSTPALDHLKKFEHVNVFHKLKLVYCHIPKVASTSWKRLLLALDGYPEFLDGRRNDPHKFAMKHFTKLSRQSAYAARQILRRYTSFVFVRNPYTRLLSAYREKLEGPKGTKITQHYHDDANAWLRASKPDLYNRSGSISFRAFIHYYFGKPDKNNHWQDMYKFCHPCSLDYDFIGHFETLEADTRYLLDLIQSDVGFPEMMRAPTNSSKDATVKEYYTTLSDAELNELSYSKGLRRDLMLFDYEIPQYIRRDFDG